MHATRRSVQPDSIGVDAHRPWTACVLYAARPCVQLGRIDETALRMPTPSVPTAASSRSTRPMLRRRARAWGQRASGPVTRATIETGLTVLRATRRFARWDSTDQSVRRQQMVCVLRAAVARPTLYLCLLASSRVLMSVRVFGSVKLATL